METLFQDYNPNARFEDLIQSVQHCDLCDRLACRNKILSKANGNIKSKVLFIAEAPGRLGADKTGIPLHGDRTGNNFETFLSNIGWNRDSIFITNAVLCNPRQENGNNATPTNEEVENCSAYLEMTISLVDPEVIVPLGLTALSALNIIRPHNIQLSNDFAKAIPWQHRLVFPLYHPAPRAFAHRSKMAQRSDYMILKKLVDPIKGLKKTSAKIAKQKMTSVAFFEKPMHLVARAFLSLFPHGYWVSQFKLTKLMYLFDLEAKRKFGKTFACDIYIRKEYGPWPPKLYDALKQMDEREIVIQIRKNLPFLKSGPSPRGEIHLDENILAIISEIFLRYGGESDAVLRRVVYLTEPMKFILKQESAGANYMGKPVLYEKKEAQEM